MSRNKTIRCGLAAAAAASSNYTRAVCRDKSVAINQKYMISFRKLTDYTFGSTVNDIIDRKLGPRRVISKTKLSVYTHTDR